MEAANACAIRMIRESLCVYGHQAKVHGDARQATLPGVDLQGTEVHHSMSSDQAVKSSRSLQNWRSRTRV